MNILRFILIPFSWIYGGIMALRNAFFKWGVLSITKVDVNLISIGNLSMGGTGKTPHVEFLAKHFSTMKKTAILLRGYRRKTSGFLVVKKEHSLEEVGDEALHYKHTFNDDVIVTVCENRVEGAQKILQEFPFVELIVLDDAFQHQYIYRDCNILLTEYQRPFFNDFVVPTGNLRELRSGKNRADIVVVTKTPQNITTTNKKYFSKKMKLPVTTPVFFSSFQYGEKIDLQTGNPINKLAKNILLVTGIGNPKPLFEYLETNNTVKHLSFKDHHQFTKKDLQQIHNIFNTFVEDAIIVTTEKDAMRLLHSDVKDEIIDYPWCYQSIEVEIKESKFLEEVEKYVK